MTIAQRIAAELNIKDAQATAAIDLLDEGASVLLKMNAIYPMLPMFPNQALAIAVLSYDGRIFWGFNSDWDALPDVHNLVEGIGLYWHFVDIIWILLVFVIYILPQLGGGSA